MFEVRPTLSSFRIERDQIITIGDDDRIRIRESKVRQTLVRTLVPPDRLTVFRVDRRHAIRSLRFCFAVAQTRELSAGANEQRRPDDGHLSAIAEIVRFPLDISGLSIHRTNSAATG